MSGRRKVSHKKIVRETGAETRSREGAQADLAFAETLRVNRDEAISILTGQEVEPTIGGVASADKAQADAGLGKLEAGNITLAAHLASDAVATTTGVKDMVAQVEGDRDVGAVGILAKDKAIASGADVTSATLASGVDIGKFLADEKADAAKHGVGYQFASSFAKGAFDKIEADIKAKQKPQLDTSNMQVVGPDGNPIEISQNVSSAFDSGRAGFDFSVPGLAQFNGARLPGGQVVGRTKRQLWG